jgi:hypothetical protein
MWQYQHDQQMRQQASEMAQFGRSEAAFQPGKVEEFSESWDTSWSREVAPTASAAATSWWATTYEGYMLLRRLALAHLIVGVCVALALMWQIWNAAGPVLMLAVGLIVAIGGTLALVLSHLDRPAPLLWARLSLVIVDLGAAGGILWLRGGEGSTLLALLPPIALAIAFFAERGGALATMLAALIFVAVKSGRDASISGWMPSLLVFLGVAVVVVAFLGMYSAQITETNDNLRWLLTDARATIERLQGNLHELLMRLRSVEQAQEPLLHERARLGDAASDLTMLTLRLAQGDASALQTLQTLRPGAYGPLAELASALARLSRMSAGSGLPPSSTAITALDTPIRAQSHALASLDVVARSLCVGANELVMEAESLGSGIGLDSSGQAMQALWQLEQHLRTQATDMALLGTRLAEIRTSQENLEAVLARASAGAKTPSIFAISDVRAVSLHSGPQVSFGASAIRRNAIPSQDDNGTVRWGNWQNQAPMAYNRGV